MEPLFVLTIGPVERFRRSKQVVSYLGLNPCEHSSGGHQHLGSISKQGNTMMRWLLVEASQTAVRFDPQLLRMYQRLKFRRGGSVAKVAVARKLAVGQKQRLLVRKTKKTDRTKRGRRSNAQVSLDNADAVIEGALLRSPAPRKLLKYAPCAPMTSS